MFPKAINAIIGTADRRRLIMPHATDVSVMRGVGLNAFTRNSGQWIQDANGVWQLVSANVPWLEPTGKGWLSEPASTNKCTCYGVPRADSLGSELLTAAQAACDSGWAFLANWSQGTGVLVANGASSTYPYIAGGIAALSGGKYYTVTYTISGYTGGSFKVYVGSTQGTIRNANGTYTETLLCVGNTNFYIMGLSSATGNIDNVSVKEAIDYVGTKSYNPGTLGAELITVAADRDFSSNTGFWNGGASISGGVYHVNGPINTGITKDTLLQAGKTYTLTYTILNYVSGTCANKSDGASNTNRSANGTYTETFTVPTGGWVFRIYSTSTAQYDLDDISLKEVTWIQNITNTTLSGNNAAILSIVTDQTQLVSDKLDNLTNAYKVYDLTTTAAGTASVDITGAFAAVVTSMGVFVSVLAGTATLSDSAGANSVALSGRTYVRYKKEGFTATAARTLRLTCAASSQLRFIIPQVAEFTNVTSPMPSAGGTASSIATLEQMPLVCNLPKAVGQNYINEPVKITQYWAPLGYKAGVIQYIWSSRIDANNYTALWYNGVIACLEKCVAGVKEYVTFALTATIGQKYKTESLFYADGTCGLKVDGVSANAGLGNDILNTGNWAAFTLFGGTSISGTDLVIPSGTDTAGAFKLVNFNFKILKISAYGSGNLKYRLNTASSINFGTLPTSLVTITPVGHDRMQFYNNGAVTVTSATVQEVYNNTTNAAKPVFGTALEIGSFNGGTSNAFAWMGETSIGGI